MDLPSHPAADDVPHPRPSRTSRTTAAVFVVVGALLLAVLILHLTGVVGPAAR